MISNKMLNSISYNNQTEKERIKISPFNILILVSLSIIIAHFVVMFVGVTTAHPESISEIILDSFVLILLLFPLLYIFVFRPLIAQINQREKVQRELLVNENKFKNLVETMSEGFAVQNNDGIITFVNNRFCEMLSLNQSEFIGNQLQDFLDEMNGLSLKKIISEIDVDHTSSSEISWRSLNKSDIHTIVSPSPIYGEDNKINGTLLVITDITIRKQMELDLIEAKNKAQESDKLKTAFLNLISHEIRTPLNIITNFSLLVKEEFGEKLSGSLIEYISLIDSGSKRLIRTIELILNMALELTSGSKPETEEILLSREILPSIIKEYTASTALKEIQFNYLIKEEASVCVDKFMISQIILHLVDNAVKFTSNGKVTIFLYRKENRQCVEIKDTGVGISKEFQKNMFKLFSQEEDDYCRTFEGNGLGLALVKKYCDLNNIEIIVDSTKHIGSVFTIIFN